MRKCGVYTEKPGGSCCSRVPLWRWMEVAEILITCHWTLVQSLVSLRRPDRCRSGHEPAGVSQRHTKIEDMFFGYRIRRLDGGGRPQRRCVGCCPECIRGTWHFEIGGGLSGCQSTGDEGQRRRREGGAEALAIAVLCNLVLELEVQGLQPIRRLLYRRTLSCLLSGPISS